MVLETDKIMFEIYREATYSGLYKVVYFTELQDHNREFEISRALAGEQMFDGFIRGFRKEEAKQEIQKIVERLNAGEALDRTEIERQLAPFMPAPAG
ncbi:MAG: hypothetical protein ACRD10_02005 [Terriglobia bacterium]